jgi:phosphotransacetylase
MSKAAISCSGKYGRSLAPLAHRHRPNAIASRNWRKSFVTRESSRASNCLSPNLDRIKEASRDMQTIVNKTFEEIAPGDAVSVERTLLAGDLRAWASAFGDADVSSGPGQSQGAVGIVTGLLGALVGSALPGPGSAIRTTTVHITGPLPIGNPLTTRLVVRGKDPAKGTVTLDGQCTDVTGKTIATAVLEVLAPQTHQETQPAEHRLEWLLERCRDLKPLRTGVVYPCSTDALAGAVEAAEAELILPVLFGPESEIKQIAQSAGLDISKCRIVSASDAEEAALQAATAAGAGEITALMKGSLHTDVLLRAVMQKETKLRTSRLMSHCALVSAPTYARRIIISDAALNIAPDTDQKRDICQNAIGFARALGIGEPKVAVLAAVEMVRTKMPATLDGAILAKMADRRQIAGGIVDGPLDLDAAVDVEAAKIKHISSPVAGIADVLIVPNIEAGNMVYKELAFMGDAQTAGLVVGARVPVILTSRADSAASRRFSAAAAVLYADAVAHDPGILQPDIAE